MCTWIVTVYAQSTMCACAVYISTTTFQPLEADCGKPKIPTTLGLLLYCKPLLHAAAVSIFANQPHINRTGCPFSSSYSSGNTDNIMHGTINNNILKWANTS